MSTQTSRLRRLLILGALGVGVVAAIVFASKGDKGIGTTLIEPAGDISMSEDSGDFPEIDAALGRSSIPGMAGPAADKAANGAGVPQGAPTTGSREPAGIAPQQVAPDGTSSLIDDRKIVQTASMRLQVKEVGVSFEEVGRVATGAGGFVASSSFSNQGESQVASVTIRVPSTQYQTVLADLRRLGVKVVAEDSRSSDVTAEYTDLGARLRNLEAAELRLLELLGRAVTINEILQVQDRLNNTRSEIEQVKGRMALLDKLTDLATIAVHLFPVPAGAGSNDGGRLGDEVALAWDNSIEFLTDIAAGVVHVIVFAWWVPILGVPALVIGRRLLRRPRAIEAVD